jgi:hypothetical protein
MMRWEPMPALVTARSDAACCAVRGGVVVLGGQNGEGEEDAMATVEVLRYDSEAGEHTFTALPPLSCGPRIGSTALRIDESESAEGQVLLLGGCDEHRQPLNEASRVLKVDLATGACTPQPPLLYGRYSFAAARLPDGRVVCAGGDDGNYLATITAEVLELPEQGSPDGVWRWRELPHMSARRYGAAGCVLSDGLFAVFGGRDINTGTVASCEVLPLDGNERCEPLPPMHEARCGFTYAAVGGCVIVAGGYESTAAVEVYEEALRRWRRLPCSLPHEGGLCWPGSALM